VQNMQNMQNINVADIEAGVRRALKAYKAEAGVDAVTAAAWAEQHLSDGVQQFVGALAQKPGSPDLLAPAEHAFDQLKAWATTKL
jgi:hypothetical protein